MDRMQETIDRVAEEQVQHIDQRFKEIMVPLLGDRMSEFEDLIEKEDFAKLKELLAEHEILITVCFRRLEQDKIVDGWYMPMREYTVYQGNRAVGSFQDTYHGQR
jgi:hypothetical protein